MLKLFKQGLSFERVRLDYRTVISAMDRLLATR